MAYFPCELCSQRFLGSAQYLYPAAIDGALAIRKRFRVCTPCFERVAVAAATKLQEVKDGIAEEPRRCWICGRDKDERWPLAFFLTWYAGDERSDWHGSICIECADGHPALLPG